MVTTPFIRRGLNVTRNTHKVSKYDFQLQAKIVGGSLFKKSKMSMNDASKAKNVGNYDSFHIFLWFSIDDITKYSNKVDHKQLPIFDIRMTESGLLFLLLWKAHRLIILGCKNNKSYHLKNLGTFPLISPWFAFFVSIKRLSRVYVDCKIWKTRLLLINLLP